MSETLAPRFGSIEYEPKLPTEDETQRLYEVCGDLSGLLETYNFGLRRLCELLLENEVPPPTYEDIGRLYALVENLKLDVGQGGHFEQELDKMEQSLREIYMARDEVRGDA
jgi:hypothetical protein